MTRDPGGTQAPPHVAQPIGGGVPCLSRFSTETSVRRGLRPEPHMSADDAGRAIDTLLSEERRYPAPPDFTAQANAGPDLYEEDWEAFWEREGRERVSWFEPPAKLHEWELPYAKWYLGGKLNVAYNCVDRHVEAGLGDKVAYHWEGEPEGDRRTITFADLQREVVRFANALKSLGVRKGTPVGIYMGMIPELPVAMLACARLGAPHTVVFGGFSAEALSDRLNDMECEVLVTQDEGWRRGSTCRSSGTPTTRSPPARPFATSSSCAAPATTCHAGGQGPVVARRDDRRRRLPARADGRRGSPVPALHERHHGQAEGHRPHDGRLPVGVAATHHYIFDVKPDSVYWCAADVGWVTGHSYIVYGPLSNGTTGVMYEGTPDFPDKDRWWDDRRALQGRHPLHGARRRSART